MKPYTPILKQYFATKERYPGVLLAMRVGDFYEFYGEDAEIASRALEIALTGREDGPNGRIPMAGVPVHSAEKYLAALLRQGYKVAICDQVEDPKKAKGLVRREVTRVVTPGTVLEDEMLEATRSNYLASAVPWGERAGLGFLELSTGEFLVTQVEGPDCQEKTIQEIVRLDPAEILLPEEAEEFFQILGKLTRAAVTRLSFARASEARARLLKQFGTVNLEPFGLEGWDAGTTAAGAILKYLDENRIDTSHIDHVVTYALTDRMRLDGATTRSLELTQNLSDGGKRMTLLEVLDHTKTPMGARLLRRWIEEPLLSLEAIQERLDAVEALKENGLVREELRQLFGKLYDLQRLVSRASTGVATPVDLSALRATLSVLPQIVETTLKVNRGRIANARREIDPCPELLDELTRALVDHPPLQAREGGYIRDGYDPEVDELRKLSREGKEYIASFEERERQRTGISKLKVGYNSVFGYFLEVPKTQVSRVPQDYIRKQTTVNAERYITAELKDYEAKVLGSEEKLVELEYRIFTGLRHLVAKSSSALLRTARALAELDVLQSLAEAAVRHRYSRPQIREEPVLYIKGGRHPVVEAYGGMGTFVPNDTRMDETCTLIVLTGPNMSGKSTYLRQNALIVLMAQMGSFVPAEEAVVGLTDRVFARIGARDELASGQSTFMVEMTEAAHILHHATDRSLVILDEIGRGTSTFDGLAIAWAIAERLAEIRAKTLFATHYHQLNKLAEQYPQVKNYRVAVREEGDKVIWLHKVLEGGADRSYGIHVARMAGVPKAVLRRAEEILADLEGREVAPDASRVSHRSLQLTLFDVEEPEVVKKLRELDTSTLTPLEALLLLDNLKREASQRG